MTEKLMLHPQVKDLWTENNCEDLRYDYPLTKDSLVIDVGGNVGSFASRIADKYDCKVIIYEPIKKYFDLLIEKMAKYKKVSTIGAAVSSRNCKLNIDLSTESTNFGKFSSSNIVQALDVADVVGFHDVDLLKINVEGDEYQILERLALSGVIRQVKNIQVQFHILNDNSFRDRFEVQQLLGRTHKLDFCFEFCWESWRIKNV